MTLYLLCSLLDFSREAQLMWKFGVIRKMIEKYEIEEKGGCLG